MGVANIFRSNITYLSASPETYSYTPLRFAEKTLWSPRKRRFARFDVPQNPPLGSDLLRGITIKSAASEIPPRFRAYDGGVSTKSVRAV